MWSELALGKSQHADKGTIVPLSLLASHYSGVVLRSVQGARHPTPFIVC